MVGESILFVFSCVAHTGIGCVCQGRFKWGLDQLTCFYERKSIFVVGTSTNALFTQGTILTLINQIESTSIGNSRR